MTTTTATMTTATAITTKHPFFQNNIQSIVRSHGREDKITSGRSTTTVPILLAFVAVSSLSSYCGVFYTRNVPSVFLSMIIIDRNH